MAQKKAKTQLSKQNTTVTKTSAPANTFALARENYILLIIGFAIIILGFILMIGGAPETPEEFNPEVFSWRRITLAPIVVLFGFIFEIYAIMKKPKEEQS